MVVSGACARSRPRSPSVVASAARTDQCGSGSRPEIELMKVSTSVRASALQRGGAHRRPLRGDQIDQQLDRRRRSRSCASAVTASSCRF